MFVDYRLKKAVADQIRPNIFRYSFQIYLRNYLVFILQSQSKSLLFMFWLVNEDFCVFRDSVLGYSFVSFMAFLMILSSALLHHSYQMIDKPDAQLSIPFLFYYKSFRISYDHTSQSMYRFLFFYLSQLFEHLFYQSY